MKRTIFVLLLFVSGALYAQKQSDYGFDKVRIVKADKIIQAEIIPVDNAPGAKADRVYYWYDNNNIHISQGGFSGKLLNGLYESYYLDHNLKEQGIFKRGLKDGMWKTWNDDGSINQVTNWKDGVSVPVNTVSFWDKINILKRKTKQQPADSLNKPHL
jgi:antitoxin component YwqK of YwqJK toxin-antitoxin module